MRKLPFPIGDVLREQIGRICHVLVGDVIIYSKTYIKNLDKKVFILLICEIRSNKKKVEYLELLGSKGGIKMCPKKVLAIKNYEKPTFRSFLGL